MASYDTKGRLPATATTTSANPATVDITLGSTARVLWLLIVVAGTTARTGGAPTYNGVEMTQIGTTQNAGGTPETCAEQWYLLDPPTGASYTLSVPNTNTGTLCLIAASGAPAANKVLALDQSLQTNGSSTNPGSTINSVTDGAIIFAGVGSGANTWNPTGRTGTQLYDWDAALWGLGAQYLLKSGTGNQAFSWTFGTSEDWVIMAASFKDVDPPVNPLPLVLLAPPQPGAWN